MYSPDPELDLQSIGAPGEGSICGDAEGLEVQHTLSNLVLYEETSPVFIAYLFALSHAHLCDATPLDAHSMEYFDNFGESGDFYGSGGKKSLDETRSDDRFSPATHSSHTSATTTTSSTQEARLASGSSGAKLTPQELLKRRMQAQLNKAFVADKKAEQERQMKLEKERQDREQGLRKLAEKLRQREADRRRAERLSDV
ncbi:unnamed protein product, partial [Dibothriocephalus latus]